ncbi:unnamed protein product, partial [Mesorhabditis belari]|uniref:F-box domain-containing protein n=1 Tax=Mesorhabditis belari TaxID=2138241 RepID=A0AAF3J862_9BILA
MSTANNQKRENCKGNPQNPTEIPSTPLQLTQKDLMREMALETQPTTRKPPISPKTLKPPLSPKSVLQSKVSQKIFRDDRGREISKAPLVRARSAVLHRSLSRSHSVTFIVQTAPRLDGLPEETIVRIAQNLSPSDLRSLSQTSRSIREQILKNRRRCGLTEIHEIHFTYQWDFDAQHFLALPLPPYETWNDVLLDSKKMMVKDTWKTMTPLTRTKILAATRSRRMSIRAADE